MDGPLGSVRAVAFFDSRASRFLIDDAGGVRRDLSAYLTALGDDGVSFVTGLEGSTITLRGLFDDADCGGPDAVLGPLRAHEGAVGFEYGPSVAAASGSRYTGRCWVVFSELRSLVGRLVEWMAGLIVLL